MNRGCGEPGTLPRMDNGIDICNMSGNGTYLRD